MAELTYSREDILDRATESGAVTVTVAAGETAWNPATTKDRPITGPSEVLYLLYPDGGIDAVVKE